MSQQIGILLRRRIRLLLIILPYHAVEVRRVRLAKALINQRSPSFQWRTAEEILGWSWRRVKIAYKIPLEKTWLVVIRQKVTKPRVDQAGPLSVNAPVLTKITLLKIPKCTETMSRFHILRNKSKTRWNFSPICKSRSSIKVTRVIKIPKGLVPEM